MRVVDLEQRTEPWSEWRRNGVSATSCAIIMGENPDKTPYQLWQELVGLTPPQDLSVIPQVRRGVKLEPFALQAFETKYGQIGLPVCAESSEHPFIRASFDGLLADGSPVEIKNLADDNHLEVLRLGTESMFYKLYRWQVMHQLIVSGGSRGYLWFWSPKHEPKCMVVDRDEELIQRIIEKEKIFWDLVETATPPALDPQRDFIPLSELDLEKWRPIAKQRREITKKIKQLKAELNSVTEMADALDAQLLELMGKFRRADALGIKVTLYERGNKVDWKGVAEELSSQIPHEVIERHRSDAIMATRITVDTDYDESKQPEPLKPIVRRRPEPPVEAEQEEDQEHHEFVVDFW